MIVTIVGGSLYEEMARHTVPLMEECLQQSVTVLPGEKDPWEQKLSILAEGVYTFVDVDIVFRKRVDTSPWVQLAKAGVFVACEPEYRKRLKLSPTFLTSGFFTINPSAHAAMLARARDLYEVGDPVHSLKDEYALNRALAETQTPLHELPLRYQRTAYSTLPMRDSDISRHYCNGPSPRTRLAHLRQACKEAWLSIAAESNACNSLEETTTVP